MRDSNIKLSSNILPIPKNGSIGSEDFVSKLTNFYRLKHIKEKYTIALTLKQQKILEQIPYCARNKKHHDPCFGLDIKTNNSNVVCRCLNEDCQFLPSCRLEIPVSEEEKELFAPRDMSVALNEYAAGLKHGGLATIYNKQESYSPSFLLRESKKDVLNVPGWEINIKTTLVKEEPISFVDDNNLPSEANCDFFNSEKQQVQDLHNPILPPITMEIPTIAPPDYGFLNNTPTNNKNIGEERTPVINAENDSNQHFEESNSKNAETVDGAKQIVNEKNKSQISSSNNGNTNDNSAAVQAAELDRKPIIPPHKSKTSNDEGTKEISPDKNEEQLVGKFAETNQETIICSDTSTNIFVDAGPGTGKTYTLMCKLENLVSQQDVDPNSIMVLCFTNAAVDEIKKRLRQLVNEGADRGLNSIDIRTFHSYAGWLINYANTSLIEEGWKKTYMGNGDFNQSLVIASNIINEFTAILFSNWKHFIVDEVQDITNDLAGFVLTIIDACMENECGVTVLGDTCQAIYDYNQKSIGSPIKSDEFYIKVFERFKDYGEFYSLAVNHRQSSELIELTKGLRSAILSKDASKMRDSTAEMLTSVENLNLTSTGLTDEILENYKNGGKVCILLRSNAKTLKVSSDLRKKGIRHKLMAEKTEYDFSPWIADVFGNFTKPMITWQEFEARYEQSQSDKTYSAIEIWERLQKAVHSMDNVIPVGELINSIVKCKLDDPVLRSGNDCDVVVSNIHRSKGREYDGVIIESDFMQSLAKPSKGLDSINPEEYRVLYVAATRPKSKIAVSQLVNDESLYIVSRIDKRYGRRSNKQLKYLEFIPSIDNKPETYAFIDSDIKDEILDGDEVFLKRVIRGNKVDYEIIHEPTGNVLGKVNYTYYSLFKSDLGINTYETFDPEKLVQMPEKIKDLYVTGIYTYIMDEETLNLHPEIKEKAPNGVWKWIEITGVGHATYDAY